MTLNRKQKILIPLIILAFVYVAWQVYDLFDGGGYSTSSTAVKPTIQNTGAVESSKLPQTSDQRPSTSTMPNNATHLSGTGVTTTTVPTAQPIASGPMVAAAPAPTTLNLSGDQNQYLQLINQYQMVKLQRMIMDEQAAIAAAKERIATINDKIGITGSTTSTITDYSSPTSSGSYQLVYVDSQNGKWTATLSKAGQYYEVNPGTLLLDGTKIIRINQQGVTLQQGTDRYFISFNGTTLLPAAKTTPPPTPVAVAPPITPVSSLIPEQATVSGPTTPAQATLVPLKPNPEKTNNASVAAVNTKVSTENKSVETLSTANKQNNHVEKKSVTTDTQNTKISNVKNITTSTTNNTQQDANSVVLKPADSVSHSGIKLTPQQQQTYNNLQKMIKQGDLKNPPSVALSSQATNSQTSLVTDNMAIQSPEQTLLQMSKNHYTVQLLSSSKKSVLTNFVEKNKLANTYIYQTLQLGKPRFVLLYGDFKTLSDAKTAISKLPASVKAAKPWIRNLASVQDAIKLFHAQP